MSQADKRMGSLENRLSSYEIRTNSQTNWFLVIISVFVTGILGLFAKVVFFPIS